MIQKKLPLINATHGSDTRNIINEIIKAINDRGLEILSESGFLTWLEKNGIKHRAEVATFADLPSDDSLNTVRGVEDNNKIYIKKENGWVPFQSIDISKINLVENRIMDVQNVGAMYNGDLELALDSAPDSTVLALDNKVYDLSNWTEKVLNKSLTLIGAPNGATKITGGGGVFLKPSYSVTIKDIEVDNFEYIIDCQSDATINTLRLNNVIAKGVRGFARFSNPATTSEIAFLDIRDCTIEGDGTGDKAIEIAPHKLDRALISGNKITGFQSRAIQIGSDHKDREDNWKNIIVTDNVVEDIHNTASTGSGSAFAIIVYGWKAIVKDNIISNIKS